MITSSSSRARFLAGVASERDSGVLSFRVQDDASDKAGELNLVWDAYLEETFHNNVR